MKNPPTLFFFFHSHEVFRFRVPKPVAAPHETAQQLQNKATNANIVRLVSAYRQHGHKGADLDPLGFHVREHSALAPELFGLSKAGSETYNTDGASKPHHPSKNNMVLLQAFCTHRIQH